MTDEKKELPWNNALWLLRPILPGNTSELVKDYLSYCVLVPGPEASRLHQRDEKFVECESLNRILMDSIDNYKHRVKKLCGRVKKFEEAASVLLKYSGTIDDIGDDAENAMRIIREAMGEK